MAQCVLKESENTMSPYYITLTQTVSMLHNVKRIRRLEELVCSGNNFVFNALMHYEPMQRFKNVVRFAGPR